MMMESGDPWDGLSASWNEAESTAPAADVARIVEFRQRQGTRRLWLVAVMEALIVAAIVAFTTTTLMRGPETFEVVQLVAVWVVVTVVLGFAIRNRRGLWHPVGESTSDYLSLCEERARRKLRTAHFVLWLVLAQGLVVFAFRGWRAVQVDGMSDLLGDATLGVAIVAAYVGWGLWFRARARRELDWATDLRRAIDREEDGRSSEDL